MSGMNEVEIIEEKKDSYVVAGLKELAGSFDVDISHGELYTLLVNSAFGGKEPSKIAIASFLTTANRHRLNPFNKEIYAFEKGGKTHIIIAIDGWLKIAHASGVLSGIKHELIMDDNKSVIAVKCIVARKDWEFHTETIEFMAENNRGTNVWKDFPVRMLKHRATAQAIRMAFNVNAMLEDEFDAMSDDEKIRASIKDSKEYHDRAKRSIEKSKNIQSVNNILGVCRDKLDGIDLISIEESANKRLEELGVINA